MAEFDIGAFRSAVRQFEASQRRLAAKARAELAKAMGGRRKKFGVAIRSRATIGQGSFTKSGQSVSVLMKIHFGGLKAVQYSATQEGAQQIDTNMLSHNPQKQLEEFQLDTLKHPQVNPKNLFVHVSFSRPENHDLTVKQWQKFVQKFLKKIGVDGAYVVTRHTSTVHDHIHLIFSRSQMKGGLVSLSNNRWVWRAVTREVESDLGILVAESEIQTEGCSTSDAQVSASRRAVRLGGVNPRINPDIVRDAIGTASDFEEFVENLNKRGIEVKATEANGKTTGVVFKKIEASEWLSGSSISREFSLQKIQAQIKSNQQKHLRAFQMHTETQHHRDRQVSKMQSKQSSIG